jgi:glycosyltransferase involved in cell wall biosynthesis
MSLTDEKQIFSLHLSTAKTWRGGENQIWLLARGLLKRSQRVLVLAPPGAPLLERCKRADIPAQPIQISSELDMLGALRLRRLLIELKPDVLHLHDGHAVLPGKMAALMIPRKTLRIIAHRRTVFDLKGRWKYSGRVDRVIAISAAVRERLLKRGIPESSIRVVHSGLEFSPRSGRENPEAINLRKSLGISEHAIVIAHAAALTGEKRQIDMLRALAKVADALKGAESQDVHLLIAGTGELAHELQGAAQKLGLEKRVHFLGFVEDLRALWSSSDMALFASEAEGLCTALIEAQAAGLPAVITRAGGMVEVIEENRTGLAVEVGAVAELAEAIVKLVSDPLRRREMGAAAEMRARDKFSANTMVESILAVYREA